MFWAFCRYRSFLLSSSHYVWNDHKNHLSIKTNHSLCCICLCLVTKQMFQSTCLTKPGGLFTHFVTSFIRFTLSLTVKGLSMWDFSCETCFCQLFAHFGTEFLGLANLTFRFVVMWSIRSFTAICLAYKWIHLHLEEFQFTEKHFLSKTLGYKPGPHIGLKFHWTLAFICVKIARLIVFRNGVLNFIVHIASIFFLKYFEIYRQKHSFIITVWWPNKRSSLLRFSFDATDL